MNVVIYCRNCSLVAADVVYLLESRQTLQFVKQCSVVNLNSLILLSADGYDVGASTRCTFTGLCYQPVNYVMKYNLRCIPIFV